MEGLWTLSPPKLALSSGEVIDEDISQDPGRWQEPVEAVFLHGNATPQRAN